MKHLNRILPLAVALAIWLLAPRAGAQGTAFTYQGLLDHGASAANGSYDFRFALYDDATAGTTQGAMLTKLAVPVSNGLFTVEMDFGNQFPGAGRWLELYVRTNGVGSYRMLSPRQALTATPYAVMAASATTAGSVPGLSINTNNYSTTLGVNNSAPAMNATVGGGTMNLATNTYAVVAGGLYNTAGGDRSVVGGGYGNVAIGYATFLGGGLGNSVPGNYAAVVGGDNNVASGGGSFVGGGSANQATGTLATVPGGSDNLAVGQNSFAAGQRAKAVHDGAFVWADLQAADFSSTASNQFLLRASGGVGINTNNPNGAALAVNGDMTVNGVVQSLAGGVKFPDGSVQNKAASNTIYFVFNAVRGGTASSTLRYYFPQGMVSSLATDVSAACYRLPVSGRLSGFSVVSSSSGYAARTFTVLVGSNVNSPGYSELSISMNGVDTTGFSSNALNVTAGSFVTIVDAADAFAGAPTTTFYFNLRLDY